MRAVQRLAYLQTQLTSITTDPVLDRAIAEPTISKLPMIKDSTDPKVDLRKKLEIKIIPNTHWMRVALESTDPHEAAQIVNAVVDAFALRPRSVGTGANKTPDKGSREVQEEAGKRHREAEDEVASSLAKNGNVVVPKPKLPSRGLMTPIKHQQIQLQQPYARSVQIHEGSAHADRVPARGARGAISGKASGVQQAKARVVEVTHHLQVTRRVNTQQRGADCRGVQDAIRTLPP